MSGATFWSRVSERNKFMRNVDLARLLGVSEQTVASWRQRGTMPRADIALRIANEIGESVEALLTEEVRN